MNSIRLRWAVVGTVVLLTGGLAACGSVPPRTAGGRVETVHGAPGLDAASLTPAPTPLPTLPEARVAALALAGSPTPQTTPEPLTLRVWWPDELYPSASSQAENILLGQFQEFRETYTGYGLEVRRKRSSGLGGILPTLQTAAPVAPGALPDLILLPHANLATVAGEGLIYPLGELVSPSIMDNLLPGARALGEVDGVLYGVPYALNLTHSLYHTAIFPEPPVSFEAVLRHETPFLFPAGVPTGQAANQVVLLQYLAAGGTLVDANGVPALNVDALIEVLAFYEHGLEAGIFDPALLAHAKFNDYWNSFITAESHLIVVDSAMYLRHKAAVPDVGLMSLPTPDGTPITALDGWVWVVTTQDPARQQQARAFLSWMMRVSQHALYTEALGLVPSQERALRLWDDQVYAGFVREIVPYARIISDFQHGGTTAQVIQESLAAVLEGTSARAAAEDAVTRLSG